MLALVLGMKTTIEVNDNVVLNKDVAEMMFGRDSNVVYRVCDCRLGNGEYFFVIAPDLGGCVDASRSMGVYADDIRVVGR